MVRHVLPALAWTLVLGAGAAVGQQQFPYVAYVAEPNVYVRSGPGQRYYPTQQLPQGFAVEVYRHDDGGWCAIRPPTGSFSWIPAHQLRDPEQHITEVSAERAVAHVGSALSPSRNSVQVMLQRGEMVEVLAAEAAIEANWVRIAAPAGEFRWLAANQLSRQPPLEVTPPVQTASVWVAQSDQNTGKTLGTQREPGPFDHLRKTAGSAVNTATHPPVAVAPPAGLGAAIGSSVTNRDPNAIDVVAGSPAARDLAPSQSLDDGVAPPAAMGQRQQSPPRIKFRSLSATQNSAAQRVEELQLRLSQIVVGQPSEWQFAQIRSEATGLLEKADSPAVRSQLRDLLDRIAQFQQVQQQRYAGEDAALAGQDDLLKDESSETGDEGLTGLTAKVRERAKSDLVATEASPEGPRPSQSGEGPLYDAVGLLKPVASKRVNAPRYALVDDKGEVLSFVTPSPDLNLQPYVGRRIGVHGKRGFMPEYRRAHVSVARVTPIEGSIRR